MYNEKIKNEYLSTLSETTKSSQKSYFKKIEVYEKKLKKDVLFFTNAEFSAMMQEIKGLSISSSLYNLPSCIKRYAKWYSENYTPIDYQTNFTVDYLKIDPVYYKSPIELIDDIDIVIRALTQEQRIPLNIIASYLKELRARYNVAVGLILLSWCGLTTDEISDLKSEELFKEENKIYIKSRKELVLVDPAIMTVLFQLKMSQSYAKITENPNKEMMGSESILTTEDFQYTEFFLKKRGKSANYSSPVSKNLINLSLSELNNNNKKITFSLGMLKENGVLYRAYQRSKNIIDLSGNMKDKDYYEIFDAYVKELSKNRFNDLKYKYRAFVKLVEKKEK